MMDILTLAKTLISADAGNRDLDVEIARYLGWRTAPAKTKDPRTGAVKRIIQWDPPNRDEDGRLPHFSTSISAAMALAEDHCPGLQIGLSWEAGLASTIIDGRKPVQAQTPALALCVAVLVHRETQGEPGNDNREEDSSPRELDDP